MYNIIKEKEFTNENGQYVSIISFQEGEDKVGVINLRRKFEALVEGQVVIRKDNYQELLKIVNNITSYAVKKSFDREYKARYGW